MELPYVVVDQLTPDQQQIWKTYFGEAERPRYREEGIWRRTQEEATAAHSGWTGPQDARRRIIHYRYRYGLVPTTAADAVGLTELYLFHHVAAPAAEIDDHAASVWAALAAGGWKHVGHGAGGAWERGDLRCRMAPHLTHPEDARSRRTLPDGYRSLDVTVTSANYAPPPSVRRLPWDVLGTGIRTKDERGTPTLVPDLGVLADFAPFQVELGCGPAVEAGIPPLHRLHEVYAVTDRHGDDLTDYQFTLDPAKDPLLRDLLSAPEEKTAQLVEMFAAIVKAEPTPAMWALKELSDAGYMTGPVITNNFDVLAARAGLPECYMRRYDQAVPPVELIDGAKALLVIGSHADRRKVQARARERGMKIVHLDPEGFWNGDGRFVPYPLEGPQDDDFVCRKAASDALPELVNLLARVTG